MNLELERQVARAVVWGAISMALFAACTTERPGLAGEPQGPKVELTRLEAGAILITSGMETAQVSFAPSNGRLESAGEGAATAARAVMNTPALGHAQLEAAVGVLGFAAAPFAAAYGAVSASRERLSPDKLSEAENELAAAMRSNAVPETLRLKVSEVGHLKTHRILVCCASPGLAATNQGPVSAVLEVWVESLRLDAPHPGQNEYVLSMKAWARLSRPADGAVLLERRYEYQSGAAPFIDWARWDGLGSVARTGYQSMAEQIADDVFQPVAGPAILIGPGQKHSMRKRTGERKRTGGNRGNRKFSEDGAFQFVSYGGEEPASFDIYTRGSDQRDFFQTPTKEPADDSETKSNTEWAMDGLENDRNSVVQLVSCLAVVPMGLWEHTFGALGKRSRDKTEKLATTLNSLAGQRRFEQNLADEVTRCLRSQVVELVRRNDEPLTPALAKPPDARSAGRPSAGEGAQGKTALEIQVLSTELVGKRANSRSRALAVQVQATIIRTSDGQELYSCPVHYLSSARKLNDWAAGDAKLLRQELEECSRQTAQALARETIARGFVNTNRFERLPLRGSLKPM